jgi:hypothetical protein
LPERAGAREAGRGARRERRCAPQRGAQRVQAEVDEVGGAGVLDDQERRLGGDEHRGEAGARRHGPARLPGHDAARGQHARPAAAEQRASDRHRGVRPWRDDDEDCHAEEREQLAHALQ